MKKRFLLVSAAVLCGLAFLSAPASAQVPQLINYQGRIAVGTTNFNGNGQFRFALVDATGVTTYWSNDGTSTAGSQPTAAVTLTVTKGLCSVLLGDTTLPNMTAVPATAFSNTDVRLRVWFNDGTNGSQLLTPDQRIVAVGYAMMAATVTNGSITPAKIAAGAVGSAALAPNLTLSGTTAGIFTGDGSGLTGIAATPSRNSQQIAILRWYEANQTGQTFAVGNQPSGVAFDGANVWVTNLFSGTVTKLRAGDGALQGTFAVGSSPSGVAFDGTHIWVTNNGSANVTKLRASDGAVQGAFAVGNSPSSVAFDGSSIWVTNQLSGNVTKL